MDHGLATCRSTSALRRKRKITIRHLRHQQGRRKVTLRLVAGDFHAVVDFRALASQADLLVKVSGVSFEGNVLQTLHVVAILIEETKMSISDMTISTGHAKQACQTCPKTALAELPRGPQATA